MIIMCNMMVLKNWWNVHTLLPAWCADLGVPLAPPFDQHLGNQIKTGWFWKVGTTSQAIWILGDGCTSKLMIFVKPEKKKKKTCGTENGSYNPPSSWEAANLRWQKKFMSHRLKLSFSVPSGGEKDFYISVFRGLDEKFTEWINSSSVGLISVLRGLDEKLTEWINSSSVGLIWNTPKTSPGSDQQLLQTLKLRDKTLVGHVLSHFLIEGSLQVFANRSTLISATSCNIWPVSETCVLKVYPFAFCLKKLNLSTAKSRFRWNILSYSRGTGKAASFSKSFSSCSDAVNGSAGIMADQNP